MIGVVLTFQAVVWLALSYLFMRSRGGSIFHPFTYYLVFHGIVFVVIPALGYIFNFQVAYYYMWFYPTEGQIIFTLWLTMVALLAFALFGWILDPTVPNLDRPTPDGFNAEEWRAYVVLAVALSPLILYSMYKAFGSGLGGEALIQMDRDPLTGIAVNTNTSGYVTDAQNALIPLCLMLIWGTRFRRWSFVPLVAYLALKLYVGWGRWTIILTVAMLGLLVLTHMKKRWVPLYFFVIGLPLFIAFQQLGANRDFFKEVLTGESTAATTTYDRWVDRFDGLDFANFDYLTYVVDIVPAQSGTYSYFTQYLQIFTEPIPRILWPGKPFGPPIDLVNLNAYGNFLGLTVSIVGDGWISGGWLGVVITLALVGFITTRVHRWFWRGEATNFKVLVYCIFLPLTIQWFRDGGISISKFVFETVGIVFMWRALIWAIQAASGKQHRSEGVATTRMQMASVPSGARPLDDRT